jgi:hypothetical protein
MACMPDVCLCPPPSPAGPIPTPLPNNAMASDLTDGAKSVLIDDNPAGNAKSKISTSTGNEVSKPTGGGVVSSNTKGAAHFTVGSMDVLIEGEGAVRHLDMATHNHDNPPNTPPWVQVAQQAMGSGGGDPCGPNCKLSTYKPNKCPKVKGKKKTPHHILPKHLFKNKSSGKKMGGFADYNANKAPCICVSGTSWHSKGSMHKALHDRMDGAEYAAGEKGGWNYEDAQKAGIKSVMDEIPDGCDEGCLTKALEKHHDPDGDRKDKKVRADKASKKKGSRSQKLLQKHKKMLTTAANAN